MDYDFAVNKTLTVGYVYHDESSLLSPFIKHSGVGSFQLNLKEDGTTTFDSPSIQMLQVPDGSAEDLIKQNKNTDMDKNSLETFQM